MTYIKQCDRCTQPVELTEELKYPIFLCQACVLLWEDVEKTLRGKIYSDELSSKFNEFIKGETPQATLK